MTNVRIDKKPQAYCKHHPLVVVVVVLGGGGGGGGGSSENLLQITDQSYT